MKIKIVGAGPAGLFFAILMKRDFPHFDVAIYEKGSALSQEGWGVVFSASALSKLELSDRPTFTRLCNASVHWQDLVVAKNEASLRIRGNPFTGVRRSLLLNILCERASELGVEQHYGHTFSEPSCLGPYDLLIGADGARSAVRQYWQDAFRPSVHQGSNRYLWLGTTQKFNALTMAFCDSDYGPLAAHAYRFDAEHSTFIVECPTASWDRLTRAPFNASITTSTLTKRIERAFAPVLQDHPILQDPMRWRYFLSLRNKRYFHGNVCLLGDALHAAHFSIGSGTTLAFQDAVALAQAFQKSSLVPEALQQFELSRRPKVEALQQAAAQSQAWFERFPEEMAAELPLLAYSNLTRSGRIEDASLAEMDPDFFRLYQRTLLGVDPSPAWRQTGTDASWSPPPSERC